MSVGKIAVRYAKALFEAASDHNVLEKVREDIDTLQILNQKVIEFNDLLENPVLNADQKHDIFLNLLQGKIGDLSLKLVLLMTENKREAYIPSVCRVFYELYKHEKGIRAARITTAVPLNDSTSERVKKILEEFYKCSIELESNIKPEIIGGFVLKVDDRQLDSSVATQLKIIRKGLNQSLIS